MFRLVIFSLFALFYMSFSATVPISSTAATETTYNFNAQSFNFPMILASKNDLVAFFNETSPEIKKILVYKRAASGIYAPFASFDTPSALNIMDYTATDGKWVSYTPRIEAGRYPDDLNSSCELFKVNDDGSISNYVRLNNDTVNFNYGNFLADGSFVGVSADQLFTFRETNNNWVLVNVFNFPKQMKMTTRQFGDFLSVRPYFQFTGNRLVTFTSDFAEIHFYDHQANNTWSLSDVIITGTTELTDAAWNGDDTVLATNALYPVGGRKIGIIYVYQRVNGVWSQTASMIGTDLGVYRFGSPILSINPDTYLIAAVHQRVFLLQRNNGQWSINGMFADLGPNPSEYVTGLAVNDNDIFVTRPNDVHTTPLCSVEPIEFTCDKNVLPECNFAKFDTSLVCDFTNQCGPVSTQLISFGIKNSLLHHVQFKINRFGAFSSRVNASFSCPAVNSSSTGGTGNRSNGPSEASTPSTGSNPRTNTGLFMGSTVPIKSSSPDTGNNNVSSAIGLIASSWLIGVVFLMAW